MQRVHDQYTPVILGSPELASGLRLFRRALSGQTDPDERTARGLQFAEDLRRGSGHDFAKMLDAIDARRSAPNYVNRVAVGDRCSTACVPPGANADPMCTADGRRICDYDRVGARSNAFAGQTTFAISPQPTSTYAFWRPRMVRGHAIDAGNPSIPRWEALFITNITVGGHPIEGNSATPTTAVLDGFFFGDYVVPDASAVPVGWPAFSNTANNRQLVITGVSLWAAAINTIAALDVLGNPMSALDGNPCRTHPDSTPVPPVAGSSYTGGGSRGM